MKRYANVFIIHIFVLSTRSELKLRVPAKSCDVMWCDVSRARTTRKEGKELQEQLCSTCTYDLQKGTAAKRTNGKAAISRSRARRSRIFCATKTRSDSIVHVCAQRNANRAMRDKSIIFITLELIIWQCAEPSTRALSDRSVSSRGLYYSGVGVESREDLSRAEPSRVVLVFPFVSVLFRSVLLCVLLSLSTVQAHINIKERQCTSLRVCSSSLLPFVCRCLAFQHLCGLWTALQCFHMNINMNRSINIIDSTVFMIAWSVSSPVQRHFLLWLSLRKDCWLLISTQLIYTHDQCVQ